MRKPAVALVVALGLGLVLAAGGCSSSSGGAATGKLRVVATTTQTADFASVVGGGLVAVYDMVKPNVDPHDFEPSPKDLEEVRRAAVVVKNGLGLDHWLDDVVGSAGGKGAVVDASAGVPVRRVGGGDDPHVWQSVPNAIRMVTNIEEALARADPSHEAEYRKNRDAYAVTLNSLDQEIQSQISTLANKKLVTNHDAFGYYVERYGLEFIGSIIPSFDTSAELSAKDVNDLVAKIKATGVKAVFSESSLPPKTAQAIGREAGVKVVAGEDSLYGDSLGPKGSDGATYVDMMRHNTREIVVNLR